EHVACRMQRRFEMHLAERERIHRSMPRDPLVRGECDVVAQRRRRDRSHAVAFHNARRRVTGVRVGYESHRRVTLAKHYGCGIVGCGLGAGDFLPVMVLSDGSFVCCCCFCFAASCASFFAVSIMTLAAPGWFAQSPPVDSNATRSVIAWFLGL